MQADMRLDHSLFQEHICLFLVVPELKVETITIREGGVTDQALSAVG